MMVQLTDDSRPDCRLNTTGRDVVAVSGFFIGSYSPGNPGDGRPPVGSRGPQYVCGTKSTPKPKQFADIV